MGRMNRAEQDLGNELVTQLIQDGSEYTVTFPPEIDSNAIGRIRSYVRKEVQQRTGRDTRTKTSQVEEDGQSGTAFTVWFRSNHTVATDGQVVALIRKLRDGNSEKLLVEYAGELWVARKLKV